MTKAISSTGIKLIQGFEGCRLKAYHDSVRVLTIGFGHTRNVKEGQTITQAQADELFEKDLQRFVDGVNKAVKVEINQNQFDALVSFSFNLGLGSLSSSELLSFVNKKEFAHAAAEFSKWCHAGGKVLPGLVRRRKAEEELFLKAIPKPAIKHTSIVEYLNAHHQASDFPSRKKLAESHGIHSYSGTAEQNTKLLAILQK